MTRSEQQLYFPVTAFSQDHLPIFRLSGKTFKLVWMKFSHSDYPLALNPYAEVSWWSLYEGSRHFLVFHFKQGALSYLFGNKWNPTTRAFHCPAWIPFVDTRELKQRQRRRQRERHKFAYLVDKNNSFARPARAFFTFVHFVAVVSKTTTWNSQVFGFMKNVSTWG